MTTAWPVALALSAGKMLRVASEVFRTRLGSFSVSGVVMPLLWGAVVLSQILRVAVCP
jgi:hypothetical protein